MGVFFCAVYGGTEIRPGPRDDPYAAAKKVCRQQKKKTTQTATTTSLLLCVLDAPDLDVFWTILTLFAIFRSQFIRSVRAAFLALARRLLLLLQ